MSNITWATAADVAAKYRTGELSPVEVVEASLQRIADVDPIINSMVTVTAESAREQASRAERRLRSGEALPPLFGVPVTVKDLVDTAGVRTTYGAVAFSDHVPVRDALAWERLKATGVILIGKTTTPEFGLLGVTESRLTGTTSTPWAVGHAAGGSSGGAAASVAGGITAIAWGSDGGGSIRVPASLCGVVGIKPSVGRIPHLDNSDPDSTEGPIARSVLDAALILDATVGPHARDRFAVPRTGEVFADAARRSGDLRGLRIGATWNPEHGPISPEVADAFLAALDTLRAQGAKVEQISMRLPDPSEFFIDYWGADIAEMVGEMTRNGHDLWPAILDLARRAEGLTAARVSAAVRERKTQLYNAYADIFDEFDIIVTPTTPTVAFTHRGDVGGLAMIDDRPIDHPGIYLHRLTEPPSHAGLPAISVPCGFSPGGLPVGLQFIAPMYQDSMAIYAASRYEAATPWHQIHPAVHPSDPLPATTHI